MKKAWKALAFGTLTLSVTAAAWSADAVKEYPARPVTLLVGFPAGGPADMAARILAERLHTEWPDLKLIVENRGGANGTLAASQLTKADPDGYTLFLATRSHVNLKFLYKKLPFDPATDFQPVAVLLDVPQVLVVGPAVKAANYAELAEEIRAKPDALTAFSTGNGSDPHLTLEEFKAKTGLKVRHIPYKGGSQGMVDMLSGRVDMSFATLGTAMGQLAPGKARALAIGSPKRYPLLPDVPTFAEVGVRDFDPQTWYGVMAPIGTPPALVEKLNHAINKVMNTPQGRASLARMGATPVNDSVAEFSKLYASDLKAGGALIERLGVTVD
jgi:tripartite-type tricarboxylate transporter receptor subunit TctC